MSHKKSSGKEIARDSLNTLGINIVCTILATVTSLLVAGFLGADNKGMVQKMQLLSQSMIVIFSFGITTATIHYVAKFGLKNVMRSIKLLYGFTVGATIVFSLGLICAYSMPVTGINFVDSFTGFVKNYYVKIPVELFFITMIYTVISIFNSLFLCIIRAKNNYKRYNIIVFINTLLMTMSSLLLFYFKTSFAYMVSSTIVVIIACGICLYTIKHNLPSESDLPVLNVGRKTMLSYGFKIYLPNVLTFFSLYGTPIILAGTGVNSNSNLGVLSMYTAMTQKLWLLPDAVGSVIMSRVSAMEKQTDKTRVTVLSCKVISVIMIIVTPIFFLVARYVVPLLLGEDFAVSSTVIILLLIGSFFTCFTRILSSSLNAFGRPELNIAPSALGTAVNFFGAFYIIGNSNPIFAAAFVACVSQILQSILTLTFFCRLYKVNFFSLIIPNKQDIALLKPIATNLLKRKSKS